MPGLHAPAGGEEMQKFTYIVVYGGGIGPDVWDGEITVEAESIHEAIHKAEERLADGDCRIFSVEQED